MVDAALDAIPLYRVLKAVQRVSEMPLELEGIKLFNDDDDVKKVKRRVFISQVRLFVQHSGWDNFEKTAQQVPVALLEEAGKWIGADPPHKPRRGERQWKHYWFPLLDFLGSQYDAKAVELPDKFDVCAYCWMPCALKPCAGVKDGDPCSFGTGRTRQWVHHHCMEKYCTLSDDPALETAPLSHQNPQSRAAVLAHPKAQPPCIG